MTSVTVTFTLEGTNSELVAQFAKLLQEPVSYGLAEIKAKKPKRILTEEQKKVIRDRFAAGRAKAALARGEIVAPTKLPKPDKVEKKVEAPKPLTSKQLGNVIAKLPVPQTGHKVGAKQGSK
ncbi:MAG: hypothetical protein ABSG01_09455 [Anaerolineales bacterium]|jgi:hypothetical protein